MTTMTTSSWADRYTEGEHGAALKRLNHDLKHLDEEEGETGSALANRRRSMRALSLLLRYAKMEGLGCDEMQSAAGDVLANLLHLSDTGLIDFEAALHMGRIHHNEEAR